MRNDLKIDLVFPIRDDVSAGLMCVKAELLYDAGIINASELNVVIGRAAAMIDHPRMSEQLCSTFGKSGRLMDLRHDIRSC